MLLKAFRNSPRNSRFVRSLKRTFLTMLKSDRKNDGPFSTRLANPHVPGTFPVWQLPNPAGAMNLPVGRTLSKVDRGSTRRVRRSAGRRCEYRDSQVVCPDCVLSDILREHINEIHRDPCKLRLASCNSFLSIPTS